MNAKKKFIGWVHPLLFVHFWNFSDYISEWRRFIMKSAAQSVNLEPTESKKPRQHMAGAHSSRDKPENFM